MKKIGLIAAAATLAAAGAAFGQGTINLELQSVTQDAAFANVYGDSASWDGEGGSFSITLFVRAQIVGDVTATGLTSFDGRLTDDGTGSFLHAALSNTDFLGAPFGPVPDFTGGRRGMTPDYRATIGEDNNNPGNGRIEGGAWQFLPLAISQTGVAGAVSGLDDVYKVTWTTTDNTARTVVLNVGGPGGGYQSTGGLVTTDSIDGGSFVITIVPAPGAAALLGLGGLVAIRRRR